MRNLYLLLQRFGFVLLFLLLEGIAFYLTTRRSNFQRLAFLNSTNEVTGQVYASYSSVKSYFYLRQENEILAKENIRLRAMVESSLRTYYANKAKGIDSVYEQVFTYTPCRVINNSVTKSQNFFTLDAGSDQGIRPDMGIISPSGIVGVVRGVSKNFAVCISVLNTNWPVSVRLKKSKDTGTLIWDGESPLYSYVYNVPSHVSVSVGDTIETSGYSTRSTIYPEGILVGIVVGTDINPDDGFYMLKVRLTNSFTSMNQVYAIEYKYKEEQTLLEDSLMIDLAPPFNE